jgi:hypothetical protein
MEIAIVFRKLWHHRRVLVLGACLAVFVGLVSAYHLPSLKSRSYQIGVASNQILVDTPQSQIVAVDPRGAGSLGTTADLLAKLMPEGDIKKAIARRAGLTPKRLVAVAAATRPGATAAVPTTPKPNAGLLTTRVLTNNNDDPLPIIVVGAYGSDAAEATRLANASVTGLRDFLASRAAAQQVPHARRLQISSLGLVPGREASRGPSKRRALAAALVIFALVCAAVLTVSALASGWQKAAAFELESAQEAAAVDHDDIDDLLRTNGNLGERLGGAAHSPASLQDGAASARAGRGAILRPK